MCGREITSCHPTSVRWTRATMRCYFCAVAMIALISLAPGTSAQPVSASATINREYAIKAAFLHQFLNYVEWPAEAFADEKSPYVIGVYGDNPFGTVLDQAVKGKKVDGRSIEVRVVSSPSEVLKCQILFVPKSVPAAKRDGVIRAARGLHVLTVGESDDFSDRGGTANFFLEGNKVRFAFNPVAVADNNLVVSSKLMALAKIVTH